jgi:hypothetical protein
MAAPRKPGRAPAVPPGPGSQSVKLHDPAVMKQIAEAAYYLWDKRGRPHGNDMHDWLEAEKVVLGKRA